MTHPSAKGFSFAVIEAAIKRPGRKDFALILSEADATVSGTFTSNAIKAAPVLINMKRIKSGRGRAVIVNSGNANACTGPQGIKDAEETARLAADAIGIDERAVYVCSTGVIGIPMPMDRIRSAIGPLFKALKNCTLEDVAKAIMTTDTFPKSSSRTLDIGGAKITISAIAKGAGMICPNMATMLCFVLTDAAISKRALDRALSSAVRYSFNRITIDGDMSTNDTVLVFANGMAGNKTIDIRTDDFETFSNVLSEVCLELATMIVRDGEGATKFITINLKNARSQRDADKAAFAIANSMLVKTAIYGNDANWGRIMAALGYAGIAVNPNKVGISINGITVASGGLATGMDGEAQKVMAGSREIDIVVDLDIGRASSRVFTCDFSEGYVKINAEYRT